MVPTHWGYAGLQLRLVWLHGDHIGDLLLQVPAS